MTRPVIARNRYPQPWVVAFGIGLLGAAMLFCQAALAQQNDEVPLLTAEELDELVGRIALYPDDLLGIVLPASTYPLQVVQAARFLEDRESDPNLQPPDEWDSSVVALLNYPEVVRMMDEDLDWTWALGEAVLDNQADVIAAVQTFRGRAYAAGNLRSDERQIVRQDGGVIEIVPASPEVIYIPYYEPRRVVVYQPTPAFYYYPHPYPLYYYPYPVGYSFSTPFFWGVTSAFTIGWHTHFLHVHHHTHVGHPYYRHHYYSYAPYYWRSGVNININVDRVAHVWQPSHRGRPFYRDDGRRIRTVYEGGATRSGDRQPRIATRSETTTVAPNRGNGMARALRDDTGAAAAAIRPEARTTAPQRTIGGVSRGASPRDAAPRLDAANRGNGMARALRDNAAAPTVRPEARTSAPPRTIAPRTAVAPQRTIGSVAAPSRGVVRSNTVPPTATYNRGNGIARALRSADARSQEPSRSAPPQRNEAPQRSVPQQRSGSTSRFAAPPQGAARSSGAPRAGSARGQSTRR
jgi:hypothetical protein